MLNNQLKFNDIMYTVTTLNNVPGAVNQVSLSARSSNDIFVIGGPPPYIVCIVITMNAILCIIYNTPEQAYQHKKPRTLVIRTNVM